MPWIEIQLHEHPQMVFDIYREILSPEYNLTSFHHFFWEPWAQAVVRVEADTETLTKVQRAVSGLLRDIKHNIIAWDSSPEEEAYGLMWPAAKRFFCASSQLALVFHDLGEGPTPQRTVSKMVHCFLNAQGMDYPDEGNFHTNAYRGTLLGWLAGQFAPEKYTELIEAFRADQIKYRRLYGL